jgi:hypothetical protein
MRGTGRAMFTAVLLLIAGVLDIIYGIAAISNAHFFTQAAGHDGVFQSLNAYGWFTLIIGVLLLAGGLSLMGGGGYGVVIGIIAATLAAIDALLSVGSGFPFWSLGVFAICLWVLWGLFAFASGPGPAME